MSVCTSVHVRVGGLTSNDNGHIGNVCTVTIDRDEHLLTHDLDGICGVGTAELIPDAVHCTQDLSGASVGIQVELHINLRGRSDIC